MVAAALLALRASWDTNIEDGARRRLTVRSSVTGWQNRGSMEASIVKAWRDQQR